MQQDGVESLQSDRESLEEELKIIIDQLDSPSGRQVQRNEYRKINNK